MFTDQGGMDIESVSHDKITLVDVNPLIGLKEYMIKKLLFPYGLDRDNALKEVIYKCYDLFTEKQMQMLEINPLARANDDCLIALDSKIILDDWNVDESLKSDDMKAGDLTEFEKNMADYDVTAVEMDGYSWKYNEKTL